MPLTGCSRPLPALELKAKGRNQWEKPLAFANSAFSPWMLQESWDSPPSSNHALMALCRFGLGRGVAGLLSALQVEVFGVQGRI